MTKWDIEVLIKALEAQERVLLFCLGRQTRTHGHGWALLARLVAPIARYRLIKPAFTEAHVA